MERLNGKAPALAYAQEDHMDKKLKRIMASRQYSQRYRMKQLQYILHLETEAQALQAHVEIASPRIHYVGQQNSLLRAENRVMKQRLAAYMGEIIFKEAQYEELKREKENLLKCLYFSYQTTRDSPENYVARSSNVESFPSPEKGGRSDERN